MVRTMPTTDVNVVGAVTGWPSSRTWSAAGLVASVTWTVRGSMSRWVVWVRPAESRTVR